MFVRPIRWLVFIVTIHDASPVGAGKQAHEVPVIAISSFSSANLTSDPVIAAANSDSLFRRLLSLDSFEFREPTGGGQGITGGYSELPNPFRLVPDDTSGFTLDLDLEQSYYGPPIDVKSDLLGFWAFGLLSILASHEAVVGTVQWRVSIHKAGSERITVLGEGACIGKPESLSRRVAVSTANKRALYVLAYRMTEAMNSVKSLHLKKRTPGDDERRYYFKADSW